MFGNHGLCGLLEEGAHGKSPKCLGGNLGDFGEFCKGLSPIVGSTPQCFGKSVAWALPTKSANRFPNQKSVNRFLNRIINRVFRGRSPRYGLVVCIVKGFVLCVKPYPSNQTFPRSQATRRGCRVWQDAGRCATWRRSVRLW